VAELLDQQGADVQEATGALEALVVFKKRVPDIIVSDLGMPKVDGYSLMRKIRSYPPEQGGGTPAIALTGFVRSEDAKQAYAAGYQAHTPKPVEPRELVRLIARVLGRE
jgi:CheY-like chemotaxis protein